MTLKTSGSIFDSLPGLEVPVGRVSQTLEELWAGAPDSTESKPADFRASQMNLVLHFGMRTSVEEAKVQFENALILSRKHPARTVVLCPLKGNEGTTIRAKVFSECHLGRSLKEMVCCEVVLLSYPLQARRYLENHVSVCLEADLPLYYWPHGIASGSRLEDYSHLLKGARRILIDTACEKERLAQVLTPYSGKLRDLADTRLLRVKQSIARFMSGFPPSSLVDGIQSVVVRHAPSLAAEAGNLLRWTVAALDRCAKPGKLHATGRIAPGGRKLTAGLSLEIAYASRKRELSWEADFENGHELMKGDLGAGLLTAGGPISFLPPEVALAEALFS